MKANKFMSISFLTAVVLSIALFGFSITLSIQAQQHPGEFTADLSGQNEFPPTTSNGTGTAEVLFNNDSSQASYFVNISGIEEITGAHIHNGSIGINGDVVATLSAQKSAEVKENPVIWFSGDIKKDGLQGSLQGKEISDLATLINNGSAYVNIHTKDNPDGAIRDQLVAGQVDITHFGKSMEMQQGGNQTMANQTMANQTMANTIGYTVGNQIIGN